LPAPAQLVGEEVVGLEGGEEEVVDCIIEVCTEEVVVGRGGVGMGEGEKIAAN
jgi:hypothetical protein